ncbi:hypothetical protein Goklo_000789, partial [Gossypium klotzschianum]|nr:hypothetical protein [Gossypium klotzschianum]
MPVGEQVKVDSLDVCNYYSHGSIVIFGKLIRFRIGAVGYAPLLVLRQYRSRQFIPIT